MQLHNEIKYFSKPCSKLKCQIVVGKELVTLHIISVNPIPSNIVFQSEDIIYGEMQTMKCY